MTILKSLPDRVIRDMTTYRTLITEIVWVHSHDFCDFCKTVIDPCCSGEISREGCPTLSHTQHRFKSYSVAQSLACVDMPEQLDFGCQVMP